MFTDRRIQYLTVLFSRRRLHKILIKHPSPVGPNPEPGMKDIHELQFCPSADCTYSNSTDRSDLIVHSFSGSDLRAGTPGPRSSATTRREKSGQGVLHAKRPPGRHARRLAIRSES